MILKCELEIIIFEKKSGMKNKIKCKQFVFEIFFIHTLWLFVRLKEAVKSDSFKRLDD